MINTILTDTLSAYRINFNSWEEADNFCVTNIFTFVDQMGNADLSEAVISVLQSEGVRHNEFLSQFNFDTSSELSLLKSIIDSYVETGIWMHDPASMRHSSYTYTVDSAIRAHQSIFMIIAYSAIKLHQKMSTSESSPLIPDSIAEVVASKQRDYGPNNVAKFGLWGLIVRVHDKIARIDNLLSKRGGVNGVKDETVFDTMLDIIGYSVVTLMWINNWFFLPMEKDLPTYS